MPFTSRIGRVASIAPYLSCGDGPDLDPIRRPSSSGGQGGAVSTGSTIGPAPGSATVGGAGPGSMISVPDAGRSDASFAPSPPCPGCTFPQCPAGAKTTISGTVYAPNGPLPLYNAIVYVPAEPLKPLASGVTCDQCGKLNSATVATSALSDAKGHFELDAPAGSNVPMVIQIGKWRRKIEIPEVRACVDNPIPGADSTRLPRNRTEGDMPRIAVTTGIADQISCLRPKLGIDRAEFGVSGQDRAVTLYYAQHPEDGPPGMRQARALWDVPSELAKYDMAIFSCEGDELREGVAQLARWPRALLRSSLAVGDRLVDPRARRRRHRG